jgi:hypothetical protein
MIRYSLTCKTGHGFDSWFQNAAAFDALRQAGQLACPVCGGAEVEKSLMAPAVKLAGSATAAGAGDAPADTAASGVTPSRPSLADPQSELEAAIAALRRQIEENSDYVGMNFATEARRMHDGDAPTRAIHGEARPEEARKLIEDGVPVAPLPFMPGRKVN